MDIRITVGAETLVARLNDSAAARDFATLLPLRLTLSDFHGIEKIADLPSRLDTSDSPASAAAEAGDIAYYAPWGNLAIFIRDFERSPGLVILGRIREPLNPLTRTGGNPVITIEAAEHSSDR
ncbi:hypothetical protein JD276_15085 [Leucobacter sp. CSA1]|uniref:Cyclophilin-like domain-containing protein n=1 Tax=Leucobacter chromiisoli TaxID=2796471 RepID=A0A934Q9N6_9MICO|nr:cyclophilin-like fold protein [Leucobacter chromiisoli]MBK0420353.1 hypothetical protein [Leucobacter chromiisoli]